MNTNDAARKGVFNTFGEAKKHSQFTRPEKNIADHSAETAPGADGSTCVGGMQPGMSLQDNDTPEGFQRGCLSDTPIFWPAIFGEFASRTSPKGVMYIFAASKGNGAPVSGVTTPMTS